MIINENGNVIGRPGKLSATLARTIYRALIAGNSFSNAARLAKISLPTINKWRVIGAKHNKSCELPLEECLKSCSDSLYMRFFLNSKRAESIAADDAIRNIKRIGRKEWTANAWFLERRYPQEWGKQPTEVKFSGHTVHEHKHTLETVSPQQKLSMAKALQLQASMQLALANNVIDVEKSSTGLLEPVPDHTTSE